MAIWFLNGLQGGAGIGTCTATVDDAIDPCGARPEGRLTVSAPKHGERALGRDSG